MATSTRTGRATRSGAARFSDLHRSVSLVFLTVCVFVSSMASASNDIQELLNSIDQSNGEQAITIQNGLQDAKAVVGKLFKYTIPSDTFKGDVQQITVSEAQGEQLPSWLEYDGNTLTGVPTHQDLGDHQIKVTATGSTPDARSQDVFSIAVVEHSPFKNVANAVDSGEPQPITCKPDEAITMVTVVVDTDLNDMLPSNKVELIKKMTGHLKLAEDFLTMLPVGTKFDKSAIVAGPGDAKSPQHPGAFITWTVGCGSVQKHHLDILQNVETSSQDGTMSAAVGHPIVGWHVTSDKLIKPQRRLKRQARNTQTAIVGPDKPTKVVMPGEKSKIDIEPTRVPAMTSVAPDMATKDPMVVPTPEPTPMKTADVVVPVTMKSTTMRPTTTTKKPMKTMKPTTPMMPVISPSQPEPTPEPTMMPTPEPTYIVINTEPEIKNKLGRLYAVTGQIFRHRFPKDVFYDQEDGDTRHLKLMLLTIGGTSLQPNFWLSYDMKRQEMIGLPMLRDVGQHELSVTAIDKGEKMQRMTFDIIVKEPAADQEVKLTHEFAMTVNADYDAFTNDIHMQLQFLNKLARVFGDDNGDSLYITGIEKGSVVVSWTNSSVSTNGCPVREMATLLRYLMDENTTFSQEMLAIMDPFQVTGIALEPRGVCEKSSGFKPVVSATKVETTTVSGREEESIADEKDKWVITVIPAVVICAMLLLAGVIACILYRKKRKGKMSDEDQNTFINKGIPVIFTDEMEEKADPPTKPLIMDNEKPPQKPPAYHRDGSMSPPSDHKQRMEDDENIEYEPTYRPPQPPGGTAERNRSSRPRTEPSYQPSPPPYVPP